jgi:vacuolar-type H+-ATPase subunit E/Vma4
MTLESVKEELLHNAKIKAGQLIDQAKKESLHIIKNAEDSFAPKKQAFEDETTTLVLSIRAREKSAANLEAKKILFEEKKKKIDDVFAAAKQALTDLPANEREKLIKRLLEKAAAEMKIGTIYCSPQDKLFVSGYTVKTLALSGGIIAENIDGTIRVDYSMDTMITGYREKRLNEVVHLLFN